MSSSDLYQSNSCGNVTLSTISNLKYDMVTDNQNCNSPWSPQLDFTHILTTSRYQEIQCGFYRPLSSYSTGYYSSIKIGQTINFMAGFNIFSSSVDGAPDFRDFGGIISIALIEPSRAAIKLVTVFVLFITIAAI